ncbi:MAG: DUF1566 domain-containing protein [Polyangiaceae bacterium]|nr:DUF1566 domain-containing protein [Polyangiaceae bacterium]
MPNIASDIEAGAPNPESCTDNGDGTITDNVTGLMWQQASAMAGLLSGNPGDDPPGSGAPMANAAVWSAATASCQSLMLAGHADWRLPTLIELVSIDRFGATPAFDPVSFPDPPSDASSEYDDLFMSSTLDADLQSHGLQVWRVVHSVGGQVGEGTASTGQRLMFRCVRVPQPNPSACRYAYPAAGTVLDTKTNLTWQQAAPDTGMTYSDALTYCSTLNVSGTGWRLPTGRELLTLENYSSAYLLDSTAFSGALEGVYWSTTYGGPMWPNSFVAVRFDIGGTDWTQAVSVRCVR